MYRVAYVSAITLAEAAEGAFHKSTGLTLEEITKYLEVGPRYAANVTISGVQLKILSQEKRVYRVTQEGADLAKAAKDQRSVVFKKFLVRFDPFVVFAMLVLKGNSLEDAARKVRVIYSIPDDDKIILDTFRSWGTFAGVIERESRSGDYVIGMSEEKLTEQYIQDLVQAIQNEWTARLFISSKIREYAFAYLGDEEKNQLVSALMKFGTESEDAVRELGKSFETFLRRLATDSHVKNVAKSNGISELASNLKGDSVILEQHRKLCDGIAVYRNAADHGVDKITMKPWKVEKDASLEAVLLGLTTIRSIYGFVKNGDQII